MASHGKQGWSESLVASGTTEKIGVNVLKNEANAGNRRWTHRHRQTEKNKKKRRHAYLIGFQVTDDGVGVGVLLDTTGGLAVDLAQEDTRFVLDFGSTGDLEESLTDVLVPEQLQDPTLSRDSACRVRSFRQVLPHHEYTGLTFRCDPISGRGTALLDQELAVVGRRGCGVLWIVGCFQVRHHVVLRHSGLAFHFIAVSTYACVGRGAVHASH